MCLVSETQIPSFAHEDIICYKNFIVPALSNVVLMTPYVNFLIYILDGLPYEFKSPNTNKKVEPFKIGGRRLYSITEGFIHCFRNPNIQVLGCTMFECIIPKGTMFYANPIEICSDKIIIVKKYEQEGKENCV